MTNYICLLLQGEVPKGLVTKKCRVCGREVVMPVEVRLAEDDRVYCQECAGKELGFIVGSLPSIIDKWMVRYPRYN